MTANEIARAIAEYAFRNGQGDEADRLVLTVDTKPPVDLGGWSRSAFIAFTTRIIQESTNSVPPAAPEKEKLP